tara:strand:+ start:887 stop:2443 length:1557 start_codon:yes stop_codon:yes gene_type:complete
MALRPFNSVAGITVGSDPQTTVILANGDITTTNLTANGVSNLGPVGNVRITGGSSGQAIVTDGSGNLTFGDVGGNSTAPMPYFIPNGESFTVPLNFQGLFSQPIDIEGELEIDGILIEVGTAINATSSQVLFDSGGVITGNLGFTFDQSSGNVNLPGNVILTGNLLPSANITYDLGSTTQRWRDLYLANNTIYLGNSTISGANGNITLTNATGGALIVAGNSTVSTIENGNSNISINANANITVSINGTSNVAVFSSNTFNVNGNVVANGVKTDNLYYANGNPWDLQQPAGSNTQIQFNNSSEFGASANLTFNSSTNILQVTGNINATEANVSNTVTANHLVASQGCVSISTSTIQVIGSDAGIFNVSVSNLSIGLVANNITFGATSSNSTFRGNLISNGFSTTGTVTTNNIKATKITSNGNSVPVTTATVIDSFPIATYRSAKYTIRAGSDIGYQSIEVLLVHDSINSIVTIYGSLSTAGVDLVTLSTQIISGNVELNATALTANTNINLIGTYVSD